MNVFVPPSTASRKTLVFSLLGLAAFLAFQALLLRHYIRVDTRPPSWDQAIHLEIALDYREAIGAGRWSDVWYLAPKPGMPAFPPVFHMLMRGAYDSPDPARAALWLNWWYLALLAVSLFAVAWRFLPDGRALAATMLFCASPEVLRMYTTQLVDLALTAWAAAAYAALLSSDGFSRWLPALGFGALHAAGLLHKWSFFSYMLPAYYIALKALSERGSRLKVIAAAALSFALAAPWYWSHAALLPSRLVQASADFAVPFWKGHSWAVYLRQSADGLGPLLWGLGLVGLLAPQYARRRENGWILAAWFACSYVFWTVVPNRQLRFLLPGLVPLGIALAATWPKGVVWGVTGLQLLAGLNFFFAWIGPLTLPTPFIPLPFFVHGAPAAEDWRIEEILRRVDAERDPGRPLANVTLVANDYYFNAPTFHWSQRRLGLKGLRMRGVTKRLSELSEFVLLKDGRLGPAGVIDQLPEAAKQIANADGWFRAAYEEAARWPLPDGSSAVLFRQKRSRPIPVKRKSVDYTFFEAGKVQVRDMNVTFGTWEPAGSFWKTAQVSAARVELRGLALRGIEAELRNFAFVPLYEGGSGDFAWDDVRALRVDRVRLNKLSISQEDLRTFVEKRVPGMSLDTLTLDKTVKAKGRWKGKTVAAEAALELDQQARRLRVRILSASYMGTPVPTSMFRPIKELDISLEPNPETPFHIELPGLTVADGRLTVP